tara:strand:- start:108964 stop:109911 length:948 start_codon:yes stop_codon:yes gene_type:complete
MNYSNIIAMCRQLCVGYSVVRINTQRLKEVAQTMQSGSAPSWDWYLPKDLQIDQLEEKDAQKVAYFLFVTTAINFCYWSNNKGEGFKHWCYKGNPKLKGSTGMAQMMIEFYEAGKFPGVHLNISQTLAFYSKALKDLDMPYAEQRAKILASLADMQKFSDFWSKNSVKKNGCYYFDTAMAYGLSQEFSFAYEDTFLKKAQLFYGMLAANFNARQWSVNSKLTAYADYRIPQVLRHLGVLEYDDALSLVVDSQTPIASNGHMERFIRAATIVACHDIAVLAGVSEADVDATLFLKTRDDAFMQGILPFHLSITSDY